MIHPGDYVGLMMKSLRESKAKLSELVERAYRGEDIVITVRGRVKARLTRAAPVKDELDLGDLGGRAPQAAGRILQREVDAHHRRNPPPGPRVIDHRRVLGYVNPAETLCDRIRFGEFPSPDGPVESGAEDL